MIRHATALMEDIVRDVAERWNEPDVVDQLRITPVWRRGIIRVSTASPVTTRGELEIDVHDRLVDDLASDGPTAQELRYRSSEVARLLARSRALGDMDPLAPPHWSVTLPRLFLDILRDNGLDPKGVIDGMEGYSGWEGIALPGSSDVELSHVMTRNGCLMGRLTLTGGAHSVVVQSCDDEDGACTIVVRDMDLPDTALAIDVVPLDQLLRHPDIDGQHEHLVHYVRRRQDGGRTDIHLVLDTDFAWGGEPPPGTDVSWRDVREGRRLRLA